LDKVFPKQNEQVKIAQAAPPARAEKTAIYPQRTQRIKSMRTKSSKSLQSAPAAYISGIQLLMDSDFARTGY
jgi:hypothetical protein